jgi:hypothetical protein
MTSGPDVPNKWALLVGINRYPMFAPRGQLSGCVNDVQVMRQALIESFQFPEDHITLLTDEQATRAGILAAMKELVARVGDDDVVVFHYSGHGSQMTDREGDAPDGLDETILPYDTGRNTHSNLDITDDEIYLWLRDLTEKTSAVTLIFDCCHSGDIVRDVFGGEVRWIEPDLRPVEDLPPSPIPSEARALLDGARDLGPSGWLPLGQRYVLIAGCSSGERSFEMQDLGGVRHGALTYFLIPELRKAEPGTTYRDIFEAAAPLVSSRFADQHPQLEGARDLEVFGVHRIEPMKFVPVLTRKGDVVTLGAGAACGLSEGSQWAVHPPGTKAVQPGAEPLGLVALTSVRAVTSEGRLLHEVSSGVVGGGMRAVEQIHAIDTRMPVRVEPSPERGQDVRLLLAELSDSPLVRSASAGESARACAYLLATRSRVCKDDPVPMLESIKEETWAVVGENGILLMPPHRRTEPGVATILRENLEKLARHQLALGLRNDGSALNGRVQAELFRWVGGGLMKPELSAGGEEVFYEGEQMVLRIVHHHDKPLYIYVLDLGLTRRIDMIYPVAGAQKTLLPERPLDVGKREGEELILFIPEEFPFAGDATDEEPEGLETLKIFATTQPADFVPLLQSGFREGVMGPAVTLSDLLAVTFGGGGYRDFRERPATEAPEDWTVLERPFRLRRRGAAQKVAGWRRI